MSQTMMGMAARRPQAQALVTGITDSINAVSVIENWYVPEGQVIKMKGQIIVHPSTWLDMRYPNRHPYYTLGHAEARRDKRKQNKKRKTYVI